MDFHRTMSFLIYIHMYGIILNSCITQAGSLGNGSAKHRLLQDLLNNYPQGGKHVLPRQSLHEGVSVGLLVEVAKVLHVNQEKETVAIRVYNSYTWRDDFLSWDPNNYGGVDTLVLPTKQLWVPDVVIYDIDSEECIFDDASTVLSTGTVLWNPSCMQEFGCDINPQYFPFDKHKCEYRLGSWQYSNSSLALYNRGIHYTKQQIQQEWSLYNINSHVEYITFQNNTYTTFVISYWIHHHAPLFAFLLIFPAVLLSVMTSVVFLLPTESENKIDVGMSIFLSFMVLLHILMDSTPKSSVTVPYLAYYFSLNSLLIAMSVFSATIISNINAKAAAGHVMRTQSKKLLTLMARLLLVEKSSVTTVAPKDAATKPSVEATDKSDTNNGGNQNRNSWILLAMVLDRLLLVVYVFANGLITLSIFVKYSSQ